MTFTGIAQREFLRRLDISNEDLALAAQSIPTGALGYIRSRVSHYGSMNVYGMLPGTKKVERFGEAFERCFNEPLEPKRKRGKVK